jgi:hypothetical protein
MLRFVAGLASVMPGTTIVEADFSTINYERMIIVLHSQASLWKAYCT